MVGYVESFSAELQAELLCDWELLEQRGIKVIEGGSPRLLASSTKGGKSTLSSLKDGGVGKRGWIEPLCLVV